MCVCVVVVFHSHSITDAKKSNVDRSRWERLEKTNSSRRRFFFYILTTVSGDDMLMRQN